MEWIGKYQEFKIYDPAKENRKDNTHAILTFF